MIKMFDWLFKRKNPEQHIDEQMTTESIIHTIEKRRALIDKSVMKADKERAEAMDRLMLFPLNYPADEIEISLVCKIEYTRFLAIINPSINDGTWEFVDAKNRLGKGRRLQRVKIK